MQVRKYGAQVGRPQDRTDRRDALPPIATEAARPLLPTTDESSVTVVPVGGVGRIGMNWTLYGHAGKWLLVDAGSAFPPKEVEGYEAVMPDPRILRSLGRDLLGLLVTHAHEDHIGAVDHVWPKALDCPIWATPFAAELLRRRFKEAGTMDKVRLNVFRPGSGIGIGPFAVKSIPLTHSIPEMTGFAITTKAGTVFHTGDWKFDREPLVGRTSDENQLRALGARGVLAMSCDSTNAQVEGPATSEGEVRDALVKLVSARKGLVVLACFATNVGRVSAAWDAARKSGRVVAVAGRSLRNTIDVARRQGLLRMPEFLDGMRLRGRDKGRVLLLCTGTQGEDRAALARMARGEGKLPALGPGDTVILSARAIPGNEKAIEEVVEAIRRAGAEVVTAADAKVHVSGHPVRGDLRRMYGLVKPRFAVPVHGELAHMQAHAGLALECGAVPVLALEEGVMLSIGPDRAEVLGKIEVPLLGIPAGESKAAPVAWDRVSDRPTGVPVTIEAHSRGAAPRKDGRRPHGGRHPRRGDARRIPGATSVVHVRKKVEEAGAPAFAP